MIDNSRLFDDVHAFLARFIAYPSAETADAHTLWIAHAHVVDAFDNTPRLAVLSPEPGSGKSRVMELTEALVPRPVLSVNVTPAYIFRKISDDAGLPTLLLDEIDTVFSGVKSDSNEDLRGLLNSGYRRGAVAGRAAVRGKEVITEDWPSFCAVALAGLNQLPDTIMTRSIVIGMKRRRQDQRVEPYRRRVHDVDSNDLRDALAEWADRSRGKLEDAWPELPDGIEDRDADVWEPIIAVADSAGGQWPERARAAASKLVAAAKEKPATLGIRLLADIRTVLGDDDRIRTSELLERLHELDEAPWASIKGEPIDARFLARMLGKYEIDTKNTIRVGALTAKGYLRTHFADAWARYLPEAVTPVTPVTPPTTDERVNVTLASREGEGGKTPSPQKHGEPAPTPVPSQMGNTGNRVTDCPDHGIPLDGAACVACLAELEAVNA